jgi:hypothetical protein
MAGEPVFLVKTPGVRAAGPFLQTDSDLRLEGLTIHWSMDVPTGKSETNMLSRSVIVATQSRLSVVHCRIIAGQQNVCVGVSGGALELSHCHCASDNGMGVFWRPAPGGRLSADQCVFEGRVGVSVLAAAEMPKPRSASLALTQNTFSVEKSFQLGIFPGPRQTLDISARGNIFDNLHHCVVLDPMLLKKSGTPTPDELVGQVRSIAQWSDEANVHRRGAQYIVIQRFGGFLSADVGSVVDWLKLWNLPPVQSVEAGIQFHKRDSKSSAAPIRLDRLDSPSGPAPARIGADPERVGPGPAYHAKRNAS